MDIHLIESWFKTIVELCIMLIECAGIFIIVYSMVRSFISFLQKKEDMRIQLAHDIMLGLQFKIGGEVLRSVIVSGWTELGTLAAIILLRAMLTFLLHWEIDVEEKRQRQQQKEKRQREQQDSAKALTLEEAKVLLQKEQ
ncbi:MAG: DUF1622 domain-containing protein [Clostridiales bacterium]|nr:DUF1622 domain-containing protein [Clostridiales bacterium]